jgi:ABC-type multidrug transport system fused ATPase/permease subunit
MHLVRLAGFSVHLLRQSVQRTKYSSSVRSDVQMNRILFRRSSHPHVSCFLHSSVHRKPRITPPLSTDAHGDSGGNTGIIGIAAAKVRHQRTFGRRPPICRGEIVLENVEMCYPARPKRRILNGLSLGIEPGSVVALVGQSGGGKWYTTVFMSHLRPF